MVIVDFIAVGIVLFCVFLSMSGALKWLMRVFLGAALGLAVLALIGLMVSNPRFDDLSRGLFRQGRVIPYIRQQVGAVGDFMSQKSRSVPKLVAAKD